MATIGEASQILAGLGLPPQQQNEVSSLTLLALAKMTQDSSWQDVEQPMLRIVDIMGWMENEFNKIYAPNSRETVRRKVIHFFEAAHVVVRNADDPSRPTNSGNTNYQLTSSSLAVISLYGTDSFEENCKKFIESHGSLSKEYAKERDILKVPIALPDGTTLQLSPGKHNDLQRVIIEEFGPRFAKGSEVAYVGDTADKLLHISIPILSSINLPPMSHDKLPDVVLYDAKKNWLFLVEAVTSHGPISPKRFAELELALGGCSADRIYVTAFLDFSEFRKHAGDIVWESEVWIAENPDHMIHYNGDKFFGPYVTE